VEDCSLTVFDVVAAVFIVSVKIDRFCRRQSDVIPKKHGITTMNDVTGRSVGVLELTVTEY
jgi:hypothetical protein